MEDFDVDENVIWTSPHTKERISMSFRGKTGLTFACLYNFKTGMQVIVPIEEIDHDWRLMCEAEELKNAQMLTELAYVMKDRDEYLVRAEAAEARAAQLEQERDGYKDAYARFADEIIELQAQLARLTLERDNAIAERDRANAGFAALRKEYDKAMTRLAAHGERVTA